MSCRIVLTAMLAAAIGSACGSHSSPTAPTGTPTAVSVALVGSTQFTASGQTSQLTATARLSDGSSRDVTSDATWQSSDPAVATVSAGLVTAVAIGSATITAAYQERAASLTASVSPAEGRISACGTYAGSGPFTVTADLAGAAPFCLTFTGNVAAALDCQGHDAASIRLLSVQGFTVRNCVFHGKVAGTGNVLQNIRIASSSNVTVTATDALGAVFVSACQGCTLSDSTFRYPKTGYNVPNGFVTSEVYLIDGQDNSVLRSTIDGGWDGNFATYQRQGCDDGIVFNREPNPVFEDNTILNVFDAGIEPGTSLGPITASIQRNTIVNAGYTGIGGYYVQGWQNSVFSGNTVSQSPSFMHFIDNDAVALGFTVMTFVNNQIANNTLIDQVPLPPSYGGQAAPALLVSYVGSGLPVNASGNVVSNNHLGTTGPPVVLLPAAAFIDGGGNVCVAGSPLTCAGGLFRR